jgi:hypothetical protein
LDIGHDVRPINFDIFAVELEPMNQIEYLLLHPSQNKFLFNIYSRSQNNCHFKIQMHHLLFFTIIPLFIEFHST